MGTAKGTDMARGLTQAAIKRAEPKAILLDGDGLRLRIGSSAGKGKWVLRVAVDGKTTERGIGSYPETGIEAARAKAKEIRGQIKGSGVVVSSTMTFSEAARKYMAERVEPRLTSERSLQSWRTTLRLYMIPAIGHLPVSQITTAQIRDVLEPLWEAKPETARRTLGRLKNIFSWVIAIGARQYANPTEGVEQLLPIQKARVKHHRAIAYRETPAAFKALYDHNSPASRALCFLILTGLRSGEVRSFRVSDIDTIRGVIEIDASRMKNRIAFIQPLSKQAFGLLFDNLDLANEEEFWRGQNGKPLSMNAFSVPLEDLGIDSTPHGFRSSLRSWLASETDCPFDLAEQILAHTPSKLVQAYQRSGQIKKKRHYLQLWGDYVCRGIKGWP